MNEEVFPMSPRPSSLLPFTSPWLLAPMDGVTDACFRDLMLQTHGPQHLGGAFTEFVRIHQIVPRAQHFLDHLGPKRHAAPVGIQFMGKELEILRDCAAAVAELGIPVLDLNFGCPARKAGKGCVGAALLDYPAEITPIIDACVDGAGGKLPVTVKIRCGVNDDSKLEEIVKAVDASGASMLTIHCRTKKEKYDESAVDWDRIKRARTWTKLPLCGNGGVDSILEAEAMRRSVGCEFVMIGRAAMANPWVFSGHQATTSEAVRFLTTYSTMMLAEGCLAKNTLARLKQMIRYWRVADIVRSDDDRVAWLRLTSLNEFLDRLRSRAK